MKAIGGYFELETRKGEHYHKNAIRLNTARNCFEYVLRTRGYRKVFIPYYTCEVMLEPIQKLGLAYEFYHINEKLEPATLPKLKSDEAFLYTNYFGLKQNCVERLATLYGQQLVVDNAQSFYAEPIEGIDTFYSARKFFGLSDGAYLYTDKPLQQKFEQDCSYDRMSHLLKRLDLGAEAGYQDFHKNDDDLIGQDIKMMSKLTEALLSGIDYIAAKKQRRNNYVAMGKALQSSNQIHLDLNEEDVPMVYPYLTSDKSLKKHLMSNKIYVATYWPNVFEWCNDGDIEYRLAESAVYIPIDQRYGEDEMNCIYNCLKKNNMLKGKTVYLRLFEPDDYEKTYLWHSDFEMQKTTGGQLRLISKEIEKNWVLSKSTHNQTDLYLAICTVENDEMIGWYSISNIDFLNRKCFCSGVIIGDKRYRDGSAYKEAGDLAFQYIINELNMNRVEGSCLKEQVLSRAMMEASFWKLEGIEREAIFKNGKYHDICHYAILRSDFFEHLKKGDYEERIFMRNLGKAIKRIKAELKTENSQD